MSIIVENRKIYFEYEIEYTLEAGIVLLGSEVKAIRNGQINIIDGHIILRKDGPYLVNTTINKYTQSAKILEIDPKRNRKLLLNKAEIRKLFGKMSVKGFTIVPLNVHTKNGRIKIEIAVVKGKKMHDKRKSLKEKDLERERRRGV